MPEEFALFHPKSLKAWRTWLDKNHSTKNGIWLVFFKKETGRRAFSYEESVEVALCFGWIDSLPRTIDKERSALKFTVRKPKSIWSKLNKERVKRLIKEQKMMPAGLKAVKIAKANGSWNILTKTDEQARTGTIPSDLQAALLKNKLALETFIAFPPSSRKQFLYWIDIAKRDETRQTRIAQTVLMSAANKKPGPKGFKL